MSTPPTPPPASPPPQGGPPRGPSLPGPPPLPRPEKSKTGCWVAGILGGCGLVAVLAVVGVVALVVLGLEVFEDQVEAELRSNAVVQQHVGNLQEFELDFSASMAAPGADDFVFNVRGTKGAGVITATCITVDADHEDVTAGTLRLESGGTYDLFPDGSDEQGGSQKKDKIRPAAPSGGG